MTVDIVAKTIPVLAAILIYVVQTWFYRRYNVLARKPERPPFTPIILFTGLCAAVTMGGWTVSHVPQHTPEPVRWTGIGVMVLGIGVWFWSIRTLGVHWYPGLATHKKQQIVQSGPYRFVRHPLYTGLLVFGMGVLLATPVWAIGLPMTLFCTTYLFRIPFEEAMMRKKFGKVWDDYVKQTGSVFPKVGR